MTGLYIFRKNLLEALQLIHNFRVEHRRFYREEGRVIDPKNILIHLIEDGDTPHEVPYIINFDEANLEHDCQVEKGVSERSWGYIIEGLYEPLCKELVLSANYATWLPGMISGSTRSV